MATPAALFSVKIRFMNRLNRNIFLIGLMGAGKTTVGKRLAQELALPFYDSDHFICEKTGVSIPTIFELEGEQGFRDREACAIEELTRPEGIVLATGGGAVLREENRRCLGERGCVIYLHAPPEVLLERTRYDKSRPLLQVENPLAKLQELYEVRDPVYRAVAHVVIEGGGGGFRKTVDTILHLTRK